jgi:hypothetical protein
VGIQADIVLEPPAQGRVVDLRGRTELAAPVPGVLEDPTGRRRLHMRRGGRAVSLLLLIWLLALVLGGLGLVPVPGVPRVISLRPSSGPPVVTERPRPRPARPDDLVEARAATVQVAPVVRRPAATQRPASTLPAAVAPARRPVASTPASTATPSRPTTSPAATHGPASKPSGTTSHGSSGTAPGHTLTAPGQTTNTTPGSPTPPGKGTPPGRGGNKTTTVPAG